VGDLDILIWVGAVVVAVSIVVGAVLSLAGLGQPRGYGEKQAAQTAVTAPIATPGPNGQPRPTRGDLPGAAGARRGRAPRPRTGRAPAAAPARDRCLRDRPGRAGAAGLRPVPDPRPAVPVQPPHRPGVPRLRRDPRRARAARRRPAVRPAQQRTGDHGDPPGRHRPGRLGGATGPRAARPPDALDPGAAGSDRHRRPLRGAAEPADVLVPGPDLLRRRL